MIARLEASYLLIAASVAIAIGLAMVAIPEAFYGGYGIDTMASVALHNELRSPGLWLAMVGIVIGLGAFRPDIRQLSIATATGFYLSYAAARTISLLLDGGPGVGLLVAMASELALGMAGALLWWWRRAAVRTN